MRTGHPVTERLSLVTLIERFAEGVETYDPFFTRTLAAALHARRERLTLSTVEELGLTDVVVTFRMDGEMQLVITGSLRGDPGEITLRYHEQDFPQVTVELRDRPAQDAYVFATLDHGWRGRVGRITTTEEVVEVRALTTVGADIGWHVRGASGSKRIGVDDMVIVDD